MLQQAPIDIYLDTGFVWKKYLITGIHIFLKNYLGIDTDTVKKYTKNLVTF